jgi:small-conductance mechanosensitive channel
MQATTASAQAATPAQAPSMIRNGSAHLGNLLDQGFTLGEIHITIGSILAGVLLFVVFVVATVAMKRLLNRYGERNRHVNKSSLYTVERLLHYLLLVIGLLWALGLVGIPIAKMTVFAGAIGVGLGFGLQAIFNNFVSGLILLFDRSLKVGDFVELASGVHGHVREIRIRATLITTNDEIDILVPNSEFVTGRVVNWTLREVARRQRIPFRVPYGTDKELVKKAALEAAAAVPFTLTMEGAREPLVWLTGFGESSLDFSLIVWLNAEATRRVGRVFAAYNWALHSALEQHGIEIPLPQRDVHVRSWVNIRPHSDSDVARAAGDESVLDNDAAGDTRRDIAESAARADLSSHQNPDGAR